MLTYSNFYKNSSSIIYEDTEGFITNVYALRSGYESSVVSVFDNRPKIKNNLLLNLTKEQKNIISYVEKGVLVDTKNPLYKIMRKNNFNFYSK